RGTRVRVLAVADLEAADAKRPRALEVALEHEVLARPAHHVDRLVEALVELVQKLEQLRRRGETRARAVVQRGEPAPEVVLAVRQADDEAFGGERAEEVVAGAALESDAAGQLSRRGALARDEVEEGEAALQRREDAARLRARAVRRHRRGTGLLRARIRPSVRERQDTCREFQTF